MAKSMKYASKPTAEEMKILRVSTPVCRLSYPALFEKNTYFGEDKATYMAEFIFTKNSDMTRLKEALKLAATLQWGNRIPQGVSNPIKKIAGTKSEGKPGYPSDGFFIRAKSASVKPRCWVGREKLEVLEDPQRLEFYSGCYVVASLTAAPYEYNGTYGLKFYLNEVWKIRNGEALMPNRADGFADMQFDDTAFEDDDASDPAAYGSAPTDDMFS